jgi:hypothetical protein
MQLFIIESTRVLKIFGLTYMAAYNYVTGRLMYKGYSKPSETILDSETIEITGDFNDQTMNFYANTVSLKKALLDKTNGTKTATASQVQVTESVAASQSVTQAVEVPVEVSDSAASGVANVDYTFFYMLSEGLSKLFWGFCWCIKSIVTLDYTPIGEFLKEKGVFDFLIGSVWSFIIRVPEAGYLLLPETLRVSIELLPFGKVLLSITLILSIFSYQRVVKYLSNTVLPSFYAGCAVVTQWFGLILGIWQDSFIRIMGWLFTQARAQIWDRLPDWLQTTLTSVAGFFSAIGVGLTKFMTFTKVTFKFALAALAHIFNGNSGIDEALRRSMYERFVDVGLSLRVLFRRGTGPNSLYEEESLNRLLQTGSRILPINQSDYDFLNIRSPQDLINQFQEELLNLQTSLDNQRALNDMNREGLESRINELERLYQTQTTRANLAMQSEIDVLSANSDLNRQLQRIQSEYEQKSNAFLALQTRMEELLGQNDTSQGEIQSLRNLITRIEGELDETRIQYLTTVRSLDSLRSSENEVHDDVSTIGILSNRSTSSLVDATAFNSMTSEEQARFLAILSANQQLRERIVDFSLASSRLENFVRLHDANAARIFRGNMMEYVGVLYSRQLESYRLLNVYQAQRLANGRINLDPLIVDSGGSSRTISFERPLREGELFPVGFFSSHLEELPGTTRPAPTLEEISRISTIRMPDSLNRMAEYANILGVEINNAANQAFNWEDFWRGLNTLSVGASILAQQEVDFSELSTTQASRSTSATSVVGALHGTNVGPGPEDTMNLRSNSSPINVPSNNSPSSSGLPRVQGVYGSAPELGASRPHLFTTHAAAPLTGASMEEIQAIPTQQLPLPHTINQLAPSASTEENLTGHMTGNLPSESSIRHFGASLSQEIGRRSETPTTQLPGLPHVRPIPGLLRWLCR